MLCVYGPDDAELLHDSGIPGQFLGLKIPFLLHLCFLPEKQSKHAEGWKEVVTDAFAKMGGKAKLSDLYAFLENHPRVKAATHWRKKIRQTIGRLGLPKVDDEQYALAL